MGMEHPVEAALGTDVQPAISQDRHDLHWWQGIGILGGLMPAVHLLR